MLKVLAGALLAVGLAALITARYLGFQDEAGLSWLAGVAVTAACIVIAVLLLRMDARRSAPKEARQ